MQVETIKVELTTGLASLDAGKKKVESYAKIGLKGKAEILANANAMVRCDAHLVIVFVMSWMAMRRLI